MRLGKKRLVLIALLAVAGLGGFVLWGARGLEPRYSGQPVSKWFDLYVQSAGRSDEARQALQSLGERAVPYLSSQLSIRPAFYGARARLRSMSNWTYRQLPAGKPIDWNRRTMAVKALGEIGRPASNAIPALIFAITNCESGAVDPARGDRYGQLRHQSGFIDVAALEALPKVGPDSRPALHALTNLLAQRPQEIAHRSAAALRALSLVTPPRGEIPGIIEVLRRREAYYWKSAFHSVSRTDLESYLGLIGRIKSTAGNNGNETLESMAYGFGTATNLSASDRKTLAAALIPLHQHLGGQPLFLLLESIVILDPAAGQQIFAYLINQTEFQQFDLRLRALESLRRMGSLAAIRFEGREGVAAQSVTRCLKDEVPIVRLWAEETLKAITGSNVVLTAK